MVIRRSEISYWFNDYCIHSLLSGSLNSHASFLSEHNATCPAPMTAPGLAELCSVDVAYISYFVDNVFRLDQSCEFKWHLYAVSHATPSYCIAAATCSDSPQYPRNNRNVLGQVRCPMDKSQRRPGSLFSDLWHPGLWLNYSGSSFVGITPVKRGAACVLPFTAAPDLHVTYSKTY